MTNTDAGKKKRKGRNQTGRGNTNKYKAQQFLNAIPGSDGVISVIARRIGCNWATAKKYIMRYPTVKAAYDAEVSARLDTAESILITSIKASRQLQVDAVKAKDWAAVVEISTRDAKWYLLNKGGERGYGERKFIDVEQRLEHAGGIGGDSTLSVDVNLEGLSFEQLAALAALGAPTGEQDD